MIPTEETSMGNLQHTFCTRNLFSNGSTCCYKHIEMDKEWYMEKHVYSILAKDQ